MFLFRKGPRGSFDLLRFYLGRHKITLRSFLGYKEARLPGKNYKYKRFKPIYIAWGLRERNSSCLLRPFNAFFLSVEVFPLWVEVYSLPKDIYLFWKNLKSRKK